MRSIPLVTLLVPATVFFAVAVGIETDSPADVPESSPVRGMTISCQTWGWEWGTDEMVESMRELKTLGVNWISIHPYARIMLCIAGLKKRPPGYPATVFRKEGRLLAVFGGGSRFD